LFDRNVVLRPIFAGLDVKPATSSTFKN